MRTGFIRNATCDLSTSHLRQPIGGLAAIGNVLLVANGFLGDLQHAFQQALVQLHDVERLLAQRKLTEQAGAHGIRCVQQKGTLGGDREQRRSRVPGLLQNGGGARRIDSSIDLFDVEEFPRLRLKLCSGKRSAEPKTSRCVGRITMPGRVHVDEGHHDRVVRNGQARPRVGLGSPLVTISQGSFIAVMAVGDDQLLIPHLFLHGGNDGRIGDLPDAMHDVVLVGDLDVAGSAAAESSRASTLPAPL